MMSFFSPWMLLGLAAAAAPIILHLLRKRTAERILWVLFARPDAKLIRSSPLP